MIFLMIVSLKSGRENLIIQELNAEAVRIIGNKLLAAKPGNDTSKCTNCSSNGKMKKMFFVFRGNPYCVFQ